MACREQRRAAGRQPVNVACLQAAVELHLVSRFVNINQLRADQSQQLFARIIKMVEADLYAERILARELHFRADALAQSLVLWRDVGDEVGRDGINEKRRRQTLARATINHFAQVIAGDFFRMRRADADHAVALVEEEHQTGVTEFVDKLRQRAQHPKRDRPVESLRDAEGAYVLERDALPAQPRAEQAFMLFV